MVWKHGDDYTKQTNAELEHLLRLRRLPYSGNKEKRVSRLVAHDENHPFPFLKLPGELRNEIYRLVSNSMDWLYCGGFKPPMKGHTEGISCYNSLQNVMAHSSLYRTCKQIRGEGLALFFRHHCFLFYVEHGGCFLAILHWLENIGEVGRNNIRHLRIRYMNKCCPQDVLYMDSIHGMLSEQATVVYVPEDAESLWRLGRSFSRILGKAPAFRIDGLTSELAPFKIEYTDYTHGLNWHRLRPRRFSLVFSLVFYHSQSWFGPGSTYITSRHSFEGNPREIRSIDMAAFFNCHRYKNGLTDTGRDGLNGDSIDSLLHA